MQPADMGSSSSRAITSEYFFVKGIKLTFGLELCFLLCKVSAAVPSSLLTVEFDQEDPAADTVDAELAEVDCGVGDAC